MSIYTRTGDTGTTALFGGKRVNKDELRVETYGSVDELNSWVGLIASEITLDDVKTFLFSVQSDLFTIGSVLAGWTTSLAFLQKRIDEMEKRIDVMENTLPALNSFILPGGSVTGSHIHVARNVCRRVERLTVSLNKEQPIDPNILKYLNRLSDLFFMLARFINKHDGAREVAWIGIPRTKKK